ncbi:MULTISPECIES: hypothetical protein [unclassified Gemella]|uniref:hypothetical protein n=1 Tax=unclassified Gemella TaxID=2624949 RepID=UPI0010746BBE|nr:MULTISPECIES: hypothetical protein [unclassified Gemella]MBF0710673.1 hypothetical protein [Gemella sp. GL1.1]MBF0746348.1 hypothetical protein [Gemella sp. 19428wG2_WT2a]NYS28017.1 hypothetical protein [Gemella sp. GL1]TFU60131.1 hypothetical protein E4T67_01455 [Gemella sp. WT2a]
MTNLSFNIYKFTLEFLKENRKKFTTREKWGIFFTIVFFISYIYFIFSIKASNINEDKIDSIISGFIMFISLITLAILFNRSRDTKTILIEYKNKYKKYYSAFDNEYKILEPKKSFKRLIEHTVTELEDEIKIIININRNRVDKLVAILTPVPFIIVYIRNSEDFTQTLPYIIVILLVTAIFIIEIYKRIEFPIFNNTSNLKDKQNVYRYLKEVLEYKNMKLERKLKKQKKLKKFKPDFKEDVVRNMKYKLLYIKKKKGILETCNVCWGGYIYIKDSNRKKHRILWGLIEFISDI